jgi:hypothetical protein
MRSPDFEPALYPEHVGSFLARAVEIAWKDACPTQEWHKLEQELPQVREAWEKGQRLFQEALVQEKSDQKSMGTSRGSIMLLTVMPKELPLASIPITPHSGNGRLIGICWHGDGTSLKIKLGRIPQMWTCD